MKKFLLALGLLCMVTTANADSFGGEVQAGDRCATNMVLSEANAKNRNYVSYKEITDQTTIESIVAVVTGFKFARTKGQIYPNMDTKMIGMMESPDGGLIVVFADKDRCVWSFYSFTGEDVVQFFNELVRQGA